MNHSLFLLSITIIASLIAWRLWGTIKAIFPGLSVHLKVSRKIMVISVIALGLLLVSLVGISIWGKASAQYVIYDDPEDASFIAHGKVKRIVHTIVSADLVNGEIKERQNPSVWVHEFDLAQHRIMRMEGEPNNFYEDSTRYTYDDQGNLLSSMNLLKGYVIKAKYEKNEQGAITSRNRYLPNTGNLYARENYSLDDRDRVASILYLDESGDTYKKEDLTYDYMGRCNSRVISRPKKAKNDVWTGEWEIERTYYYDELGLLIKEEENFTHGGGTYITTKTIRNKKGETIRVEEQKNESIDVNTNESKPKSSSSMEYKYLERDEKGNWTRAILYTDGFPIKVNIREITYHN